MKFVWQFLVTFAITAVGGQAVASLTGHPWLSLLVGLVTAVLAVTAYRWVVRRTERREVTEFARRGAVGKLVLATLLGLLLFGFVIMSISLLGFYEVRGTGSVTAAAAMVGFMAAAATTEEVLFRGVLFRRLERWTGTWVALAVTSSVFGLMHIINPNADWWGAAIIALTAGLMLTSAYIMSRNLWVPIGIHFGWNFAEAGIFSTEVSGNGSSSGLLDAVMSGPRLVTGGALGPEGSIFTVVGCGIATIVFLWVAKRRGRVIAMRRGDRPVESSAVVQPVATLPR